MEEKSIMFTVDENGVAELYDDTWDITIHCTSEEEQKGVIEKINRARWIPVNEDESGSLPDPDEYVLLSFVNRPDPTIGRYERKIDGSGNWYLGDFDITCLSIGLFVNAWMPLPENYREE